MKPRKRRMLSLLMTSSLLFSMMSETALAGVNAPAMTMYKYHPGHDIAHEYIAATEATHEISNDADSGSSGMDEVVSVSNRAVNQTEYDISEGSVIINNSCGDACPGHRITGTSTTNTIVVESGTHNITLAGVDIDVSQTAAFQIKPDATVTLTLLGTNILKSGPYHAGLEVPEKANLMIQCGIHPHVGSCNADTDQCGTLTATGGIFGAGIGSGQKGSGGHITINGGVVTTYGGSFAAGIGGGGDGVADGGDGGDIIIRGGAVTAYGGVFGAGIGGAGGDYGHGGHGGNITIEGGMVTASGGDDGAGIGGGGATYNFGTAGTGGNITIKGGTVMAYGKMDGAGIGGGGGESGDAGSAGKIIIEGDAQVTAKGDRLGAGIGGGGTDFGYGGSGGDITIKGGVVMATGGISGAGIGGGGGDGYGRGGAGGNITIEGGVITAHSGHYASGIGGGDYGTGGNITISSGTVMAHGSMYGSGIGGDYSSTDTGTFQTGAGDAVIIAVPNIQDTTNRKDWSGLIFNGKNGKVHGNYNNPFYIRDSFETPIDGMLTISEGEKLEIGKNVIIKNNGTIINSGIISDTNKIKDGIIYHTLNAAANQSTITFRSGVYDGNAKEGDDVVFEVTANPDFIIDHVAYKIGEDATETKIPQRDGIYTIPGGTITNPVQIIVTTIVPPVPDPPNGTDYTIDYINETLHFEEYCEINLEEGFYEDGYFPSGGSVSSLIGTTLYIRRKESPPYPAGQVLPFQVPERPATPVPHVENTSVAGKQDGEIRNVTPAMEYKEINSDQWISCEGTTITGLAAGTYLVRMKAVKDTSFASLAATVIVEEGAEPTYTLTITPPTFEAVTYGDPQPEEKPIIISNSGNSEVNIDSMTIHSNNFRRTMDNSSDKFIIHKGSDTVKTDQTLDDWLLQPSEGLKPGLHKATIIATYNNNTQTEAEVVFLVTPTPTYDLTITAPTFDDIIYGDPQPDAKPIIISNRGNSDARINHVSSSSDKFIITEGSKTVTPGLEHSLNNWTIRPKEDLPVGRYEDTIIVTYSKDVRTVASAEATVTFEVKPVSTSNLDIAELTFDAIIEGDPQPDAKSIIIKNTGNADATISHISVDSDNFIITEGSTTVNAGETIDDWTIQPKKNLAAGRYEDTITVTYDHGVIAQTQIHLLVSTDLTYTLTITAPTFDDITFGDPQPAAKPLSIFNRDSSDIIINHVSVSSDAFIIHTGSKIIGAGQTVHDWTIQPKDNLPPGRYNATVTVTYDYDIAVQTEVSLLVKSTDDNSGSSGGNSGSSGGSSGSISCGDSSDAGVIIRRPDENKPDIPTTAQTKIAMTDSLGNVTITKSMLHCVISLAQSDVIKHGNTANGIELSVPIKTDKDLGSVHITIKRDALDKLISSCIDRFTIRVHNMADLTLSLDALTELKKQNSGDLILTLKRANISSQDAQIAIGNRPVYNINLWKFKNGQKTPITTLNNQTITISIPYTLKKCETISNLRAVYVGDSGNLEWMSQSIYDEEQKAVVFEVNHFGVYGIGYKNNTEKIFTDITNHWAEKDIMFIASRGIVTGTSATTFSPNMQLTRGMLVTILGRLECIDLDRYKAGPFIDVAPDDYYAPYVNWAAETGVVHGYNDIEFGPRDAITREQLAVMIKNYCEKIGYTLPKKSEKLDFADSEDITFWAKDAVQVLQQADILSGRGNNQFGPQSIGTRAEIATVMHRFIRTIIDAQTTMDT